MAKKFIDDKNIERILAAIDEKYLDKNEYYSILNNTTSPTDEYLQFVRDGDIVYSFNGSRPVQVDIRAFTGRDGVDGKDGKDAVNQVVSFVFCRSKDGIPDPPSGGEFINTLPNRPLGSDGTCIWKDVPQGEGTTYMSKRMFSSDGNHDSAWSDPVVWQDSADFQVEYSADYTPGTHKDGLPSFNSYYKNYSTIIDVEQRASAAELAWRETCRSNGYGTWSDEVENPKYMATCSLKDGVWSDWSITQIQGENGISQYEYIIYKRSHTKPTETFNNNEGSYNNPHPTFNGNNSLAKSWTESIPEGLGRLWRVSRTYVSSGNNGNWSDIILWEDRPGFQVEYSSNYDPSKGDLPPFDTFYQAADNIEAAEGAWRSKCKNLGLGTWSDSSNNAKYMATCSLKDGSWTAWTVTKIVGESSEHLELTNEFDQIYVNENNEPIAGQTWSTGLKFFVGTTEHTIASDPTVIPSYSGISYSFIKEENKITGINFNLNGSVAINSNTVDINISYNGHTKTLTLKKFKGEDDYDIWASSTYYKVNKIGNTTTPQIEVNIAKSKVGQESGVEYLDQVPQGFQLVYKSIIDNKESEICTMSAGSAILEFTKNPDQSNTCYLNPNYDGIKIELLKDNELYDFVYIEKLLDGQDGAPGGPGPQGESAWHIELVDEMDQVYVNSEGKALENSTYSIVPELYCGGTKIDGKKFSFKIGNVSPLQERDNYTYSINKGEPVSSDIIIHVYYNYVNDPTNGETYSAHSKYTIKRLEADYDMDLIVNPTQVVQHADNSYSHEQISIKVSCRNLQDQSRSVIDKPSDLETYGYTIYDGTSEINDKFDINVNGDEHLIILKRDKDDIIVDQVTVNIVKDGQNGGQGDPGISSFLSSVYTRSYRKPARPEGGNYNDSTPTGCDPTQVAQGLADVKWTDGILAGDLPLWCSQRTFYSIDNDPSDNVWSDPFLLVDSQYFQVEYAPKDAKTDLGNFGPYYVAANGNIKEAEASWRVVHAGWSDTTENAFWMATCRNVKDSNSNETSWTDWQVTRIAGEKGDPGVSAEWTDYRYHASASYTDAPAMSNPTNIDGPTGWTESPNSTPAAPYIWVTTAKKTWDSDKNTEIFKDENGQWSTPYCSNASGKDGVSISTVTEYYLATNQSSGVTTESKWNWTPSIQTITKDKPYLWNYEKITYDGGKQPTETIPVIIGTYGQDGDPGKGIKLITEYYALNNDPNTKPTGYGTKPDTNTWSTTPKVSTPTARYLWNFEVITWTVGDPTYTDPVIIGVHGEKGESGSGLAKVPYYAGVVENKPYEASEYATPYVTDANGDAYMLIVSKANGSEINDENGGWAKMDQFSAIFASLALIDNGTVGDAVFNNGYMFSKKGQIYTEGETAVDSMDGDYSKFIPFDTIEDILDPDIYIPAGKVEPPYVDDNEYPIKFVPSLLFNFKDGSGYLSGGAIKFNKPEPNKPGVTIEKGVAINADVKIGDFAVTEIGTGSNKTSFVFANNGTWGYDLVTGNRVNKLRAYVTTNEPVIHVDLSNYSFKDEGVRILEGCILTDPNKPVYFEGYGLNVRTDQYGVLQYVAISDSNGRFGPGEAMIKPLNQKIPENITTYQITSVTIDGIPGNYDIGGLTVYSGNKVLSYWRKNLEYKDPNDPDKEKQFTYDGSNTILYDKPDGIRFDIAFKDELSGTEYFNEVVGWAIDPAIEPGENSTNTFIIRATVDIYSPI